MGWPTLACHYEGVFARTSHMNSSLPIQQCPACLVHLIWIVLQIGGRWPYSCCFVGCCFQDLFIIAFLCSFRLAFSLYVLSVSMWCIYRVVLMQLLLGRKCFILLDSLDFYMMDNLSIVVHVFARCSWCVFSYMNLSTNFREPPFSVEMSPWLKHMYSILSAFTWRPMPPAACSKLCCWDLIWVGVFAISAMLSA